jgi:hypothetical protein
LADSRTAGQHSIGWDSPFADLNFWCRDLNLPRRNMAGWRALRAPALGAVLAFAPEARRPADEG